MIRGIMRVHKILWKMPVKEFQYKVSFFGGMREVIKCIMDAD